VAEGEGGGCVEGEVEIRAATGGGVDGEGAAGGEEAMTIDVVTGAGSFAPWAVTRHPTRSPSTTAVLDARRISVWLTPAFALPLGLPPMSLPDSDSLTIQRGWILAYRIFDVGDEIALDTAERLLADAPGRRRVRFTREGAHALEFASAPLDIELGKRTVELVIKPGAEAELSMRFFDYGAVSVEFELPIPDGTPLADLLPLCDEIFESKQLEELARREIEQLTPRLSPAILGRHEWRGAETYTVVFIQALRDNPPPSRLIDSSLVAKLLVGEAGPKVLADDARRDVLKHAHSYLEDDLAIIDWNSAFVLEPSGSRDIPEILEFATSQLLELRYYDNVLDAELARIYDDFAIARRHWRTLVFSSPYERLARNVLRRFIDLSEFTERVDNALKVFGDFYLARVYQSAVRRFRIPSWQGSIDGKQALVARAYDLLKGEIDIRRSTFLEIIVIVLIAVELWAALRGR
jgi:hypothetical protein